MPSIVVGMEADKIAVQDAKEQSFSHGENPVDLAARERSVKEEADLDILFRIANLFAEHLW
jgi:hypothetical protein